MSPYKGLLQLLTDQLVYSLASRRLQQLIAAAGAGHAIFKRLRNVNHSSSSSRGNIYGGHRTVPLTTASSGDDDAEDTNIGKRSNMLSLCILQPQKCRHHKHHHHKSNPGKHMPGHLPQQHN